MPSWWTVALLGTGTFVAGLIVPNWNKNKKSHVPPSVLEEGAVDLVGNTPMIRLPRLSRLLGVRVLAKCEFLNPGGSSKDRLAKCIVNRLTIADNPNPNEMGLAQGSVQSESNQKSTIRTVYEGTVGSTGVSLAWLCRLKGLECHIVMPDDQSAEKYQLLEKLGARVDRVRPVPIANASHFCRRAQQLARQDPHGILANQFENLDNIRAHYEGTAPEIYAQTEGGHLDALILGAGTGGTLAGCARYLKPRVPGLQVILADPQGSGLANKVKHNVMYTTEESEGKRRRHQVDTVVEGVGINRMTRNLDMVLGSGKAVVDMDEALKQVQLNGVEDATGASAPIKWIDDAFRVTDEEAAGMARWMVENEGLFLGSSSCVNLVAVVKYCRRHLSSSSSKKPWTVVTMLCDSGHRHLTKFWNDEYLAKAGIDIIDPSDARFANLDFIS